jgi:bisphosphoglycerate-independent phosphoglycerate mutase (AlkP superfamily)
MRPEFLFLGFGETDEHAHAGHYMSYYRALARVDDFIGRLQAQLKEMNTQGHPTYLLVTTDHGRSRNFRDHGQRYPESAESFLLVDGEAGLLSEQKPKSLSDIRTLVEAMLTKEPRTLHLRAANP